MTTARRLRSIADRVLPPTTIAALALLGTLAAPAAATPPNACGLITQHDLAKAFGLTDVVTHTATLTEPGNTTGVLRQTCHVFAWRGPKPTNTKRKRAALLNGTLAQLNVDTWAPDEGANAGLWRMRFDSTVKKQRGTASARFLKKLHGTRLVPPRYGADYSIAFRANTGKLRRAQGLWWRRAQKTLISMTVVEATGKPVIASLNKVASAIVPEFTP